jgi:hypothetical protein
MTIASVVLGLTSFGVLSYLFIVISGTAFESCSSPGAHMLRHHILPTLRSISSGFKISHCRRTNTEWWNGLQQPWYAIFNIVWYLFSLLLTDCQCPLLLMCDTPIASSFRRTVNYRCIPTSRHLSLTDPTSSLALPFPRPVARFEFPSFLFNPHVVYLHHSFHGASGVPEFPRFDSHCMTGNVPLPCNINVQLPTLE